MTPDQIRELKKSYGSTPDVMLARILECDVSEVRAEAKKLALGKDKRRFSVGRMPRWTVEECEMLRELYPTTPNFDIARKVGRTIKSVVAKAHNMGLKKTQDRLAEMGRQNIRLRRDRQ